VDTSPDTGSDENIISRALAEKLALEITELRPGQKQFCLANGKRIDATGKLSASCAFARDPADVDGEEGPEPSGALPNCVFYVFQKLTVPVIMGMVFL
jgi:hypothetical protein